MAGKSKIDKALESGDWSQLEKDARKALQKAGAALVHAQDDPQAEIELEAAEVESGEPSVEDIVEPADDAEDELPEPDPEPQDLGLDDDEDEETEEKPAKAKTAKRTKRKSIVYYRYALSGQEIARRRAAEEQEQHERMSARFGKNWLKLFAKDDDPVTLRLLNEAVQRRIEERQMRENGYVGALFDVSKPTDWKRLKERSLASALHGTDLRFGHPKRAPNRPSRHPYYGYEPKTGR